jgi:tripartite-type tricarboxylate transporter receptor subunit TctC
MEITRKQFLYSAGALTLSAALGTGARAQDYPSQDIRMVCAFPPGSGADVLVRHFAEKLRPIAGRTVIVENKSGAGGNIATEYVARAKPDGYTIYVHAGTAVARTRACSRSRRSTWCATFASPPPSIASRSCSWSMPRARTRPSPS